MKMKTFIDMIINDLVSFLFPKIFTPEELLPTIAIFAALKVLAFLSALLKPAAVSLFVLPPTICLAFPKCHSTVSVFIVCGFIFLPFSMQNISIAMMWSSSNDFIQNKSRLQKKYTLRQAFCSSSSHAGSSN